MPLKFCANLSFMFQESSSLIERYSLAKQCGFQAVECAFPYSYSLENIKQAKEAAGVKQVLINVNPGDLDSGELGFAAIPGQQEKFRSSLEQAINYSKALDCKLIHIMAGRVKNPSEENDKTYEDNLYLAAEVLKDKDIVGVIEPINSITIPDYYLNNVEKALNIIKKINKPQIRLLADLFHWKMMKLNLDESFPKLFTYIGHVQIAQAPNRNEPDSAGDIDFQRVFKMIESLNYKGWIGLEYKPLTETKMGLKWLESMGQSLEHEI